MDDDMDSGIDPRNVPAQPHRLATLTTTANAAIGAVLLILIMLLQMSF